MNAENELQALCALNPQRIRDTIGERAEDLAAVAEVYFAELPRMQHALRQPRNAAQQVALLHELANTVGTLGAIAAEAWLRACERQLRASATAPVSAVTRRWPEDERCVAVLDLVAQGLRHWPGLAGH